MIIYKDEDGLVIDKETIKIKDIAMISIKTDTATDHYLEIDINDKKKSKIYFGGIAPHQVKQCIQKLTTSLVDNGVNGFYQMGNRLINLANVKSASTTKVKQRGKQHAINIEFKYYTMSLVTNKTIAERAIKEFDRKFNQYTQSVAL